MKKLTKVIALILTLCMVVSFGLFAVACNGGGDNGGSGAGGTGGSGGGTGNGGTEITCSHDNVIVCDECGKVALGDEFFVNYVKSGWATVEAGKGYNVEINATATAPLGQSFDYEGENGSVQQFYAKSVAVEVKDTNLIVGFDAQSRLYLSGNLYIAINAIGADDATIATGEIIAEDFSLVGTVLKVKTTMKTTYVGFSEQLQQINNYVEGPFENEVDILNLVDEDEMVDLAQAINVIIPTIVETCSEVVVPFASGILDANKNDVNNILANMFDQLFAVEKVGEDYVFTMDGLGSSIKSINTILNTKFPVLVDQILGEGAYDKLPQTINSILDMKISEILDILAQRGITVDGIISFGDQVLQKVFADDQITLEGFLSEQLQTDVNIKGYIDLLKDNTIRQIVTTLADVSEQDIEAFISQLTLILEEAKEYSILDMFVVNEQAKEIVAQVINVTADYIDEMLDVKMVMAANGSIKQAECTMNIDFKTEKAQAFIELIEMLFTSTEPDVELRPYNAGQSEEAVNVLEILMQIEMQVNVKVAAIQIPTI